MSARNQSAAKTYRFGGAFKPKLDDRQRQPSKCNADSDTGKRHKKRAVFYLVRPRLFFTAGFLNIVKE
jgi:hypothetical protein